MSWDMSLTKSDNLNSNVSSTSTWLPMIDHRRDKYMKSRCGAYSEDIQAIADPLTLYVERMTRSIRISFAVIPSAH